MSDSRPLNGVDYLMRGVDDELRRHGYAGNSCQIILELAAAVSPDALRRRLAALAAHCPVLGARASGLCRARWRIPARATPPKVRVHRDEPELLTRLLNDPIDVDHGELARFDLIECEGGRMKAVFTWTHMLMDARSAEYFVAVVGREELPLPASEFIPLPKPPLPFKARVKGALKNFLLYNEYRKVAPTSPGRRYPAAPKQQRFRVERFSAAESAQVRAHASRLAGVMGEAQYHAAVALIELQKFQQQLGCPSPSFVIPVPVAMRPKGNIEPLFSNQITSLLIQLLPAQMDSVAAAILSIKNQTAHAMREGIVEGCTSFIDFLRILPLRPYMAFMRTGLKGEICSLFYGNTAAVNPLVTTFLGAPVTDFAHVAALPKSPGLGTIFHSFRGELRVTVIHLAETLDETEAARFADALRARLLDP